MVLSAMAAQVMAGHKWTHHVKHGVEWPLHVFPLVGGRLNLVGLEESVEAYESALRKVRGGWGDYDLLANRVSKNQLFTFVLF